MHIYQRCSISARAEEERCQKRVLVHHAITLTDSRRPTEACWVSGVLSNSLNGADVEGSDQI